MTWRRVAVFIVAGVPLSATAICGCPLPEDPPPVTRYTCNVVQEYPHDPAAFTQGLLYYEGVFYESTGLNGRSPYPVSSSLTQLRAQRRLLKASPVFPCCLRISSFTAVGVSPRKRRTCSQAEWTR